MTENSHGPTVIMPPGDASTAGAQDGCHGTYETVPLPAASANGQSRQSAVWWFVPTGGFSTPGSRS